MTRLISAPPKELVGPLWRRWLDEVSRLLNVGSLGSSVTQAGVSGSAETTLFTANLLGNLINFDRDSLLVVAGGTVPSTVNNKRWKVKLGSTTLFDSGSLALTTAVDWRLVVEIYRNGAASQKSIGVLSYGTAQIVDYGTGSETWANKLALTITGQGGASNDIILEAAKCTFSRK